MVKEITQYQSDSGKTFQTRRDALIDDLAHAIKAAGNDVIAKNVANEIANNIATLYPTIKAIHDETPAVTAVAPALPCFHEYAPVKGEQLRRCRHCDKPEPVPFAPHVAPPTITAKPEQE